VIGLEGRLYSCDISHVEGFPYKDQIEVLFFVMVYCMYSQHITLSCFSLISFFNCNILIKGTISPICAEIAVKPQSINLLSLDHYFAVHRRRFVVSNVRELSVDETGKTQQRNPSHHVQSVIVDRTSRTSMKQSRHW